MSSHVLAAPMRALRAYNKKKISREKKKYTHCTCRMQLHKLKRVVLASFKRILHQVDASCFLVCGVRLCCFPMCLCLLLSCVVRTTDGRTDGWYRFAENYITSACWRVRCHRTQPTLLALVRMEGTTFTLPTATDSHIQFCFVATQLFLLSFAIIKTILCLLHDFFVSFFCCIFFYFVSKCNCENVLETTESLCVYACDG